MVCDKPEMCTHLDGLLIEQNIDTSRELQVLFNEQQVHPSESVQGLLRLQNA